MNPTCDPKQHPIPCACCQWRLEVELPKLREDADAMNQRLFHAEQGREQLRQGLHEANKRLEGWESAEAVTARHRDQEMLISERRHFWDSSELAWGRVRVLENAMRNMCPGCDESTVFPCLACQLVPKAAK